jgi:hypothetical protein
MSLEILIKIGILANNYSSEYDKICEIKSVGRFERNVGSCRYHVLLVAQEFPFGDATLGVGWSPQWTVNGRLVIKSCPRQRLQVDGSCVFFPKKTQYHMTHAVWWTILWYIMIILNSPEFRQLPIPTPSSDKWSVSIQLFPPLSLWSTGRIREGLHDLMHKMTCQLPSAKLT